MPVLTCGNSFARLDGVSGIDVTLNSDVLVSGIISVPFEGVA